MLLTITTTYQPATDLGYLLHKHPERVQSFPLSFGQVHIFYPEANAERCTAALLLDIDSVSLVRNKDRAAMMDQYVNDRPYVASSFLSVAISEVLGTALHGRCAKRPELVEMKIPLQATLSVVPCRGGEGFLRQLFEPLGYTVIAQAHILDEKYPEWGMSPYYTVTLEANCRLSELLTHLYVLVPVLDNDKHYWIGDAEVEKLLRHGKGWLENHEDSAVQTETTGEAVIEERLSLHEQRLGAVMAVLRSSGARSALDLGCGEGKLLKLLLQDKTFVKIVGVDVSYYCPGNCSQSNAP